MYRYIIAILCSCITLNSFSQTADEKVEALSLKYFGVSPFGKTLDSITNELIQTKNITVEHYIKRTDTTTFYFSGYSNYNPFSFTANKTHYILLTVVNINSAHKIIDSLATFWIIVSTDSTENGKNMVQKQYTDLSKEFKTIFKRGYHQQKTKNKKLGFERTSFYEDYHAYPAIIISCGKEHNSNDYSVAICYHFQME
jgi:hypothetical protein